MGFCFGVSSGAAKAVGERLLVLLVLVPNLTEHSEKGDSNEGVRTRCTGAPKIRIAKVRGSHC